MQFKNENQILQNKVKIVVNVYCVDKNSIVT